MSKFIKMYEHKIDGEIKYLPEEINNFYWAFTGKIIKIKDFICWGGQEEWIDAAQYKVADKINKLAKKDR